MPYSGEDINTVLTTVERISKDAAVDTGPDPDDARERAHENRDADRDSGGDDF